MNKKLKEKKFPSVGQVLLWKEDVREEEVLYLPLCNKLIYVEEKTGGLDAKKTALPF